jgi:hypothetical protein
LEAELGPEKFNELKKTLSLQVMAFLAFMSFVSAILSFFMKEDLRRLRFDDEQKAKLKDANANSIEMKRVDSDLKA